MIDAASHTAILAAAAIHQATPEECLDLCAAHVLPAGATLLLGVSGGSDSMALLAAAHARLPGRVRVVHVQHGLRAEAALDEAFVREACAARALQCRVIHAPPTVGDPQRTETAARRRRLLALQRAAQECGARWVLLAHHRDDALETLLLNVSRGHRGDRALAGIPALRSLCADVRLLRPFLCARRPPGRARLAAFRAALGVPCIEDASNRDLTIPRNRLRAWLSVEGAADVELLARLQAAARSRVQRRVGVIVARFVDDLQSDGLGALLPWHALTAPQGDAADEHVAELLRLLGPCLAASRRIDPRASIVAALRRLASAGRGQLLLPADPRPLGVRASRQALHLVGEPLAAGTPEARVLGALGTLSLWLE